MGNTKIEWTRGDDGSEGRTWNPIAGCSVVSPGCTNCYAMRMAARIEKMLTDSHYNGLTKTVNGNPVWTGKIARAPDHIFNAPLKWKKPTRVFVNSMSDLFHSDVPDEWIDEIFRIMAETPQHTYQILTKRPVRMRGYVQRFYNARAPVWDGQGVPKGRLDILRNLWLGVSVEDQSRADERIPRLLETPAAVRFISAEPLLGPLDLRQFLVEQHIINDFVLDPLSLCIVGGESGPVKRLINMEWMRDIRDQCKAANVPLFVKQIDKVIPIPADLAIREWPKESRY